MNKKILITGANGQLGSEIRAISPKYDFQYFFTDISELDIINKEMLKEYIIYNQIDIVINCAAYTNVDKAEDDAETADKINHLAVKNLADVCAENKLFLVHVSTDYVFDGTKNFPYVETDSTSPLGVYGRTKLQGENAVIASGCESLVIRTSWLYSSFGNNFVKTMRRLTAEKESLKVVFDQVGTPTYAGDLAKSVLDILSKKNYTEKSGIYHFSNEGVCSWYDFAMEIRDMFGNECDIQPCHSNEFPSKVKRPNFSVLDKSKIKSTFGLKIPHWKEALLMAHR